MLIRSNVVVSACVSGLLMLAARPGRSHAQTQTTTPHGIQLAFRDTTCLPCRAFYEYANGGWLAHAPVPAENESAGAIQELDARRHTILGAILDSLAAVATTNPADEKLRSFFKSCVDVRSIESRGTAPIRSEVQKIERIQSVAEVVAAAARLERLRIAVVFSLEVRPSPRDSRHLVANIRPLGLGLGDREIYLATDSASAAQRARYARQVERTFMLAGDSLAQATQRARNVLKLETAMAGWTMSMMDRMDPRMLDHPMTARQLDSVTPAWSWERYFTDLGRPKIAAINVEDVRFLSEFGRALDTVPLHEWRDYVLWRFMQTASRSIGGAAVDSLLGDFGRGRLTAAGSGARQDFCVEQTEQRLGWLVGRLYVQRSFTPAARQRAQGMVENIRRVLGERIDSAAWMTAGTRAEAKRKLAAYVVQIGYPERWPDYASVRVAPGRYWENLASVAEFQTSLELAKIGTAPSASDWPPGYWPQTADAFFNPNLNTIGLAAGYLQPPMFDPAADDAANYGAFGAVIAHEMTHAFDDQGRQFDARGNLRDWWTASDQAAYARLTATAIEQFAGYVVVDSLHINGRQTLNENLADIGGLQLAYAAFERVLANSPRTARDGLTPEQRFFIAYAQSRRGVFGAGYLRDKVASNNHSPDKWRVIGAIANMPEFAAAFHCAPNDPLVRPESIRVRVW
jgi:putative endopeptidase